MKFYFTRLVFFLLLLSSFVVACIPATPTLTFTEYYDNGLKAFEAGDYETAIQNLNKAIELDPETTDAYAYRGEAYSMVKEYEKALKDVNTYLDKVPSDGGLLLFRGGILIRLGKFEQGMADLEQSVAMYPANPDGYNAICWNGSLFGEASAMIPACEKAVELAPENGFIIDSRGVARAIRGDLSGALEDFKVAVAWMKENEDAQKYIAEREWWINELEAGRNPFDETTLQKLRDE